MLGFIPLTFLKPDEQLVLEGPSSIKAVTGPGAAFYTPIINRARKRKALQLEERQYATIKDTLAGLKKQLYSRFGGNINLEE